jgi:hypothetical protein
MPSKFFPPSGSKSSDETVIDRSKRYDVYRTEQGARVVVHRNVLIRGSKTLGAGWGRYDHPELLELQQPNGSDSIHFQISHRDAM